MGGDHRSQNWNTILTRFSRTFLPPLAILPSSWGSSLPRPSFFFVEYPPPYAYPPFHRLSVSAITYSRFLIIRPPLVQSASSGSPFGFVLLIIISGGNYTGSRARGAVGPGFVFWVVVPVRTAA